MGGKDFLNARFRYIEWLPLYQKEKPYEILLNVPQTEKDSRRTNLSFRDSTIDEVITDVRGFEEHFKLDLHGFSFHRSPTTITAWDNKDVINKIYVPEMEDLVRELVPGADRVFTYDWRLRDSASQFPRIVDMKDPCDRLRPATEAHVDNTLHSTQTLMRVHLGKEADGLLKKRHRLINLWRPIHKVQNWPLAVCDSQTVQAEDLITVDRVRREYVAEGAFVKQLPDLKWYYLADQDVDEIILLKIADSCDDVSKFCIHASVSLGEHLQNVPRESIEMRMFIFTDD